MPQSVAISLLVLGGVLLLIAILGGNFKIFGAEVSERISSGSMRFLAGVLGIIFIFLALSPGTLSSLNTGSGPAPGPGPPSASTDGPKSTSPAGAGIVFDPPSNVRTSPSGSAAILCSVNKKSTIRLLQHQGSWYSTDVCGSVGYIHESQVKFSE